MRNFTKITFAFALFLIGTVTPLNAQDLVFQSSQRTDGVAFFAIDKVTGQLSYMRDYGSSAGIWKKYGKTARASGKSNLAFQSIDRKEGAAFFVMDASTGQIYFMLDYGSNSGNWKKYGGLLPSSSSSDFGFRVASRDQGTAFFAMNKLTGQIYYMLDYGSSGGKWKSYGGVIPK